MYLRHVSQPRIPVHFLLKRNCKVNFNVKYVDILIWIAAQKDLVIMKLCIKIMPVFGFLLQLFTRAFIRLFLPLETMIS